MLFDMKITRRILIFTLLLACVFPNVSPNSAKAQELNLDPGFDPNHVLEDEDIFDVNGMSYDRMVSFLRTKGTLADYRTPDIDGVPKTAAEIIWRVANSYKINPKYLMVLIQKEQSLVEDPHPSQKQFDWAAGYGVCDSCSMNDPAIQNYKGFASQMEWAAKQHREKYLIQILGNGKTIAGKAPGKPMNIDGEIVTPKNNATAMLYSYTPHIHGNLNLWRIWRRWFSLVFPDGTVVRGIPSGKTYLLRLGQKRPFASPVVTESLVDPEKAVEVSDTELDAYPDGPTIQFPKFALLKDPKNAIWLLTEGGRRHITDMETFNRFGFNADEIIDVQDTDLQDYEILPPIDQKTEFPQGRVLQDTGDKSYWYVEDDVKQLIPDKAFLSLYFSGRNIKKVSSKALAKYKVGETYRFHDAELVRGIKSPAVSVIQDGKLRPIPSAEVFETLGWKWKNVVTVPDNLLSAYPVGEPFSLNYVAPPEAPAVDDTVDAVLTQN